MRWAARLFSVIVACSCTASVDPALFHIGSFMQNFRCNLSKVSVFFNSSIIIVTRGLAPLQIVGFALTCFSIILIGYNAIDDQVNAGCITRTLAQACWLLRDLVDQCGDRVLGDGPNFFLIAPYLYYTIFYNAMSQERNCRVMAERTTWFNPVYTKLFFRKTLLCKIQCIFVQLMYRVSHSLPNTAFL